MGGYRDFYGNKCAQVFVGMEQCIKDDADIKEDINAVYELQKLNDMGCVGLRGAVWSQGMILIPDDDVRLLREDDAKLSSDDEVVMLWNFGFYTNESTTDEEG